MDNQQATARRRRTFVIVSALLIVGILVSIFLWNRFIVQKVITLEAAPGTTISFGYATEGDESPGIAKEIIKTNGQAKVRVKPGWYGVLFSGQDYAGQYQNIEIPPNNLITTPNLSYSPAKLTGLLAQGKDAIRKVVSSANGLRGYRISYEKLYGRGDWYAAKLKPSNQLTQDILGIILEKKDNKWRVAAAPSIVFYIGDFPTIPEMVIRDINNH